MLRDKRYMTRSLQSDMPGTSTDINCTSLDSGKADITGHFPPSKFRQTPTSNSIIDSVDSEQPQFKELSSANKSNKSPTEVLFNDKSNAQHNIQLRKFDCFNHNLENDEMVLLPQTNLQQSYQQHQHQDNTVLLSGTSSKQEPVEDYFHHNLSNSCCCSHVFSQNNSLFSNTTSFSNSSFSNSPTYSNSSSFNSSLFSNTTQRGPEFIVKSSTISTTTTTTMTNNSSSSSSSSSNSGSDNINNSVTNHMLQVDSNSKSSNEFLNLAPSSSSSVAAANGIGPVGTCGAVYCDCPMSACQDIYCDGSLCSCQNVDCDSSMNTCQNVPFGSSVNICCRDMSCSNNFSPQNMKYQGQVMFPKSNTFQRNSYKSQHRPLSNVNHHSEAQRNKFWGNSMHLKPQNAPNAYIYDLMYNNANEQMGSCIAVKSEDSEKLLYSEKYQIWQYTTCHQTFPSIKHQNKNPGCCSYQKSPNSLLIPKVEKPNRWNCTHQSLSDNCVFQEQLCKACRRSMELQHQHITGHVSTVNYLHTNQTSRNLLTCDSSSSAMNNMMYKNNSTDFLPPPAPPSQQYLDNDQPFFNSATTTSTSTITTTSTITMTATTPITTTTAAYSSNNSFSSHCCSSCSVIQPVNGYNLFPSKISECSTPEEVGANKASLQYDQHSVISFMSSDYENDNMIWPASEVKEDGKDRSLPSPPVFKNVSEALHRFPESPKVPLVCMEDVIVIDTSPGSECPADIPNNCNSTVNSSSVKTPTPQQQQHSCRAKTTTNLKTVKKLFFDEEKCENPISKNSKQSSSSLKHHRSQENTANSTNKASSPPSNQKNTISNKPIPVFSRSNRIRSPSIRYKDDVLSFPLVFPSRSIQSASNRVSEIVKKSRVYNRRCQSDIEKDKKAPDKMVTQKTLKQQMKHTLDSKATTNLPLDRRKVLRSTCKLEDKSPVKLEKDTKVEDKKPVVGKEIVLKQKPEDHGKNLLNKISPSLQNEDGRDKCHKTFATAPLLKTATQQSHQVNKSHSFEDREDKIVDHTTTASACRHFKTESKPDSLVTASSSFTSSQTQPSTASVTINFSSTINTFTVIKQPLPLSILSIPEKAVSISKQDGTFVSTELNKYLAGETKSVSSNIDTSISRNKRILSKHGPFCSPAKTTPFCDNTYAFEGTKKSKERTPQKTTGIGYNTRSRCSHSSSSNTVVVHDSDKIVNNNNANENTDNVANGNTDNVTKDNIDFHVVNVKDNVDNAVNNVDNTSDVYSDNVGNNHSCDNFKSLPMACNSYLDDSVNSNFNKNKAGQSFSLPYNFHRIEPNVGKMDSASNLPESSQSKSYSWGTSSLYEPDFDEVDGILFMSFPTEESLQAHIAVERNDKWESTAGHMSSISNILNFHRWKETQQAQKFPRPAFDKNMNLRGLHMRLKRYCKLLRSEWLKIKQKNSTRNNHRKSLKPNRFQMITRNKRWTRNNSGHCTSIASRNKNSSKFQKLHWRTEARLLRGLKPEEVRQMGMKKKRRKKFIFTHRKGCKRQDVSGDENSDSGSSRNSIEVDAVDHTSVMVKEVKKENIGKNGYIHPTRNCCKKQKVVSVEEMSKAVKISKPHFDEEKPVIEKSAHLLYHSDEMYAIRKLGEFEMNESSMRKRTRSQVEYLKEEPSQNQRPNSLPLTTFTQSMAQAATTALHDSFIRKNGSAAKSAAFSEGKHDTDMSTQVDSLMDGERRLEEASQLILPLGGCKGYKERCPNQGVRLCNTSEEELDKETVRILLARQKLKNEKCNKPGCRYGCICHLCWISENYEELTKTCAISTKACDKEYCRLGCICDNNESTKLKIDCAKPCCELTCDPSHNNLFIEKSNKRNSHKNSSRNKSNPTKNSLISPLANECVNENCDSYVQDKAKLSSVEDSLVNKEDTSSHKSKLPKKDKYASLPRRQMTHRTAKNLDAISRKAMMFYETSEMYHLKKKRNQSSLRSHVAGSRRRFSCRSTKSVQRKASGSGKENSKSSTPFKRTYSLRRSSNRHLNSENFEKSREHSGPTLDPYAYPGQSIENCVVEIDQKSVNKHYKQFGGVTSKVVSKEDTENYNVWNKDLQKCARKTRMRTTGRKTYYQKSWSLRSKGVKFLNSCTLSARQNSQQVMAEGCFPQSGWLLRSRERLAKTPKKEPVRELPLRRSHTRMSEAGNEKIKTECVNTMKMRPRKASSGVNISNKTSKLKTPTARKGSPQAYHEILETVPYKNNVSLLITNTQTLDSEMLNDKTGSLSTNTFQKPGITTSSSDLGCAVSESGQKSIIPNSSSPINISNQFVQLVSVPFPTNENSADASKWKSGTIAVPVSVLNNTPPSVPGNKSTAKKSGTCYLPKTLENNIMTTVSGSNADMNEMMSANPRLLQQFVADGDHESVLMPSDTLVASSLDQQCVIKIDDDNFTEAMASTCSLQPDNLDSNSLKRLRKLKMEKVDSNLEAESHEQISLQADNPKYWNIPENIPTPESRDLCLEADCYEDLTIADDEGYHITYNSIAMKDKRNSRRFRNDMQRTLHMSRERERRHEILSKMSRLQLIVYEEEPENQKILPKQVILDTALEVIHKLKVNEENLVSLKNRLYTKNNFLWEKLSKIKEKLYKINYRESEINKILDDAGLPFDMYKPPVISVATPIYEDMGSPLKFVPSNHPPTLEFLIASDEEGEVDVCSTPPHNEALTFPCHLCSTPDCNEQPNSNNEDVLSRTSADAQQRDIDDRSTDVNDDSSTLMIGSVYSLAPENYENLSTSYNTNDSPEYIQLD